MHISDYGSGSRNGNQWSFDMSFAHESFKNVLILKSFVSTDRAQSEELGTLYFLIGVGCIFLFFPTLMIEKWQKLPILQCPLA